MLESSNIFSAKWENGIAAHLENFCSIDQNEREARENRFDPWKTYANRNNSRQMPGKLSLATYADRPKISKTNAAKAMEHPNTWKKKRREEIPTRLSRRVVAGSLTRKSQIKAVIQ